MLTGWLAVPSDRAGDVQPLGEELEGLGMREMGKGGGCGAALMTALR